MNDRDRFGFELLLGLADKTDASNDVVLAAVGGADRRLLEDTLIWMASGCLAGLKPLGEADGLDLVATVRECQAKW